MRQKVVALLIAVALLLAPSVSFAADLTVQKPSLTGTVITYSAAAAGGDTFTNTGYEVLHVRAGATPVVVTITSRVACNHGVTHHQVVTVAANTERTIGPFKDLARWNNATQKVSIAYDQVATITVAVISGR